MRDAYGMPLCFCFNDTATTEIYTLSLHDALPIYARARPERRRRGPGRRRRRLLDGGRRRAAAGDLRPLRALRRAAHGRRGARDRKSTRLNSIHANISYAVFCLKKKKNIILTA